MKDARDRPVTDEKGKSAEAKLKKIFTKPEDKVKLAKLSSVKTLSEYLAALAELHGVSLEDIKRVRQIPNE